MLLKENLEEKKGSRGVLSPCWQCAGTVAPEAVVLEVDGDLARAGGEDLLDHLGEVLRRLHPDERRILVARALANDHFCKMKHLDKRTYIHLIK